MRAFNTDGVSAPTATETEICQWVADGTEPVIGFTATGTWSAEFGLYVDGICHYVYQTGTSNRTAYIADRAFTPTTGTVISLRVKHEAGTNQVFKGTILG